MTAANTHGCFAEFVGQKLVGVMFGAMPVSRADLASGTKTLVFEDGRGLTISSKGTYWIESKDDVWRAIRRTAERLDQTERELGDLLSLAGHVEDVAPSQYERRQ